MEVVTTLFCSGLHVLVGKEYMFLHSARTQMHLVDSRILLPKSLPIGFWHQPMDPGNAKEGHFAGTCVLL